MTTEKPRFGQMWVWRWAPKVPLMCIGGSFMLMLPSKEVRTDDALPRAIDMTSIDSAPENWTLLEDVDAEQG